MSKDFTQFNVPTNEKSVTDFFEVRGNTLYFDGILRTKNFLTGKLGVEIKNEGLVTSSINIAGSTTDTTQTVIPGALTHTGNTAGFYGVTPISRQTVTFGNTDNEIGGLTISGAYSQAEVQALRDKCEELADDCRNLRQALSDVGIIS